MAQGAPTTPLASGLSPLDMLFLFHLHSVHGPYMLLTRDGDMPDEDRVQEAGHREQHITQELLEAAWLSDSLPAGMCQGAWLASGKRGDSWAWVPNCIPDRSRCQISSNPQLHSCVSTNGCLNPLGFNTSLGLELVQDKA